MRESYISDSWIANIWPCMVALALAHSSPLVLSILHIKTSDSHCTSTIPAGPAHNDKTVDNQINNRCANYNRIRNVWAMRGHTWSIHYEGPNWTKLHDHA
jgi:hypothetical protein